MDNERDLDNDVPNRVRPARTGPRPRPKDGGRPPPRIWRKLMKRPLAEKQGPLRPPAAQAGGVGQFPQAHAEGEGRSSPVCGGGPDSLLAAHARRFRARPSAPRRERAGDLLPGPGTDLPRTCAKCWAAPDWRRSIPTGQLFDPYLHQAVETVNAPGRREHEIVEELQRGYKIEEQASAPGDCQGGGGRCEEIPAEWPDGSRRRNVACTIMAAHGELACTERQFEGED